MCLIYLGRQIGQSLLAGAEHHLPMTLDQENLQFSMESNASVAKSSASQINLAQLWHETQVYPKHMY
jgi:hypothetical protein